MPKKSLFEQIPKKDFLMTLPLISAFVISPKSDPLSLHSRTKNDPLSMGGWTNQNKMNPFSKPFPLTYNLLVLLLDGTVPGRRYLTKSKILCRRQTKNNKGIIK